MTSAMTRPMKSIPRPWSAWNSEQTTFPMRDSWDTVLDPLFSSQIEKKHRCKKDILAFPFLWFL
jgi:hypothetical protein